MSEYIKLNDFVRFNIYTYHPSSGQSTDADSTPRWFVYDSGVVPILNGEMQAKTGLVGAYIGSFQATDGNGFASDKYYSVEVSGSIDNQTAFTTVKEFVIDDLYDVNIVQVSGENVNISDFQYQDTPIYFANIKYVYDGTNGHDEYAIQWYQDDQPVTSGDITNPAISIYNTSDGSAVIEHQKLTYASPLLGVLRHNEVSSLLASGEPYLVETSGTINSSLRTWKTLVGIDVF